MQWVDILSGQQGEEHDFPGGLVCWLGERRLVQSRSARLEIAYRESEVTRLALTLDLVPEALREIASAGLWGMTASSLDGLEPGASCQVLLEAGADLLQRYRDELCRLDDKVACLNIVAQPGDFPEFLKLPHYRLVRWQQ